MSQPLLEPGDVLAARYRIEMGIGRGGYATVYRATRLEDDRSVALKLMHHKHLRNPDKIKRFQREARLVTRLHHKNVVEMLDYGHTEDGVPFIIFELLRGHSLKYRLRTEGALSFSRTCQIAIQVLRALEAAHALEIAHRDIKPANIYLCAGRDDDFVKVLDFGIAKALADKRASTGQTQLTAVGQLLGTPAYMSPEQIKGFDVGLTCDLYSLGLVMSELLSGRKLVTGANEQMILLEHLSMSPHVLSEAVMETPLGRVIAKAIEKEPNDRFSSAKEMLAAVEVVAAAERFGAASRGGAESTPPPSALSLLRETVRTGEQEAVPPRPSLAGLKETVRTSDSEPGSLAGLQQTVRMDPNVPVDDLLRQHGVDLPPLRGGAARTHEMPASGLHDGADTKGPPRTSAGARASSSPMETASSSVLPPPAATSPSAAPSPSERAAKPSPAPFAPQVSTDGRWLLPWWAMALLFTLAAAAAVVAYWLGSAPSPPSPP